MSDKELVARWCVRNMDAETIKKIRLYALQNDLSIAEALNDLVEKGLQADRPVDWAKTLHQPVNNTKVMRKR